MLDLVVSIWAKNSLLGEQYVPAEDLGEEYVPLFQASEWQQSLEIQLFTLGSIYAYAEESNSKEFCSSHYIKC